MKPTRADNFGSFLQRVIMGRKREVAVGRGHLLESRG